MGLGSTRNAAALAAAALSLGACGVHGGEGQDCPRGVKAATPSGYCLPRYLSLKSGEVFARKGPGKDYATVFVYHARGLPVQVVDETTDWRRICDPDGGLYWVHRSMVEGSRTVMAPAGQPVTLRRLPADGAAAAAYLRPRSLATLGRCQGPWCEVSAGGASGWLKSSEVWGLSAAIQCH
jgi:SH3-like domain-containing protein